MPMMTRRGHLAGLMATGLVPAAAQAADPPIPPQGIGNKIRHISYSDQGGRPDGRTACR